MLRYFKKVERNSSQSGLPGLTLEKEQRASEEIANIRYSQLPFLSESPNIILVNISGYTVYIHVHVQNSQCIYMYVLVYIVECTCVSVCVNDGLCIYPHVQ